MFGKLLIFTVLVAFVLVAGCAKEQSQSVAETSGSVDSTASAISDAGSISGEIEDNKTESELDSMSNTLSGW